MNYALCIMLLCSCDHKELCFHHDHIVTVQVGFDWTYAPTSDRPLMSVWLYGINSGEDEPYMYYISGTQGGFISVPEGDYTIVAHPAEMEFNRYSFKSVADKHIIHTRQTDSSEKLFGASEAPEDIILEPEPTWIASVRNVHIDKAGITYECIPFTDEMAAEFKPVTTQEQIITLYPYDPMCYYSLEVKNVELNVRPTATAGSLEGLSKGVYAMDGANHASSAAISFDCHYSASAQTITARFVTFGRNPDAATPHLLSLYLVTSDGVLYRISTADSKFDLSEQVVSAPDPHHVHLVVDGLQLNIEASERGSGKGPFGASTNEYQEIHQEITI